MHKVLDALEKLHSECKHTDQVARSLGLLFAADDDRADFSWGISEYIRPRKQVEAPMRISMTRDTFLMPDSNIAYDYGLGFQHDWQTGSGQLFVAYRLTLSCRFKFNPSGSAYHFPVTIFQELVSGKWRGTAVMRHGEEQDTPYVRPAHWKDLLAQYELDEFGELADGMSVKRARSCIDNMLLITAKHAPSRTQLVSVFSEERHE